jgi:GntR family transcriptional regulator, arabinose operon transcriptional repressor
MKEKLLTLDLRHDSSGRPKHERLKEHFVNEIVSGRLRPGQALPSERQMVASLGIAHLTIRQAMKSLESDGLIRRVQGKGTFIESDARRKLKRGQDIFALVVPETRGGFFPSLLHSCEAAASQVNHQMLVCNTDDNVDRQASIILQLLDKEVGGVAIMPTSQVPTPQFHIRQLQTRGIPVVFCHRRVEGISAPLLATPYTEVGCLAGKTLLDRGHRRIAYLATEQTDVAKAYEAGLRQAIQSPESADGDSPPQMVCAHYLTFPNEEEAILAMLQQTFDRPDRPTAIFASFDTLAEMIYLLLPRLGLRVPEDVSLMGFGGAWRDGAIVKQLTSVVLDEIATGAQAISLLYEMRNGQRPIDDNTEIVLELGISEGETLAAPATS